MNLAQKIQSALSFLVDSLSVRFLVGFLVKMNTWISVALHHLHLFSEDGNSVQPIISPLKKSTTTTFILATSVGRRLFPHYKAVYQFPVFSLLSTTDSSHNRQPWISENDRTLKDES